MEYVVAEGARPRYLTARSVFGLSLIIATIVPFIAGASELIVGKLISVPLQAIITFLAGIHISLTSYLLFDRRIRDMIKGRPFSLIFIPIMIFLLCLFINLYTWESRSTGHSRLLVYFTLGVICWQFWHFGKQNVGVYSFLRLSESRAGGMSKTERRLIVIGSALGVTAAFSLVGDELIKQYAKNETFEYLRIFSHYIGYVGSIFQYGLLAFALYYVIANRIRFSPQLALIFVLCSNFFFPQYLKLDQASWSFAFACNTLGHGIQYIVFLGFHAMQFDTRNDAAQQKNKYERPLMILALLAMAAFISDLLIFHRIVSMDAFSGHLSRLFGHGTSLAAPITDAIVTGILLNHFWFDSFFWRFKDSEARKWMTNRYSFLFKPSIN